MSIEQKVLEKLDEVDAQLRELKALIQPPAPEPVENWSGLPKCWMGEVRKCGHIYYAMARNPDNPDALIYGQPHPTRAESIASIPRVINAARCLEGLPPIDAAPTRELTDADLPDGYGVDKSDSFPGFFFYVTGHRMSPNYATRPDAIQAAIYHDKAWKEAAK